MSQQSDILTPEQVRQCRNRIRGLAASEHSDLSRLAASHEALRSERDALLRDVEKQRNARPQQAYNLKPQGVL